MEIYLISFLFISLILNLILFLKGIKVVKQNEQLEDFLNSLLFERNNTKNILKNMMEEMKTIDSSGSFESDDEVGAIFGELKSLIERYNKEVY